MNPNKTTLLETLYSGWGQQFTIDEILFEHQTDHQHLIIFTNTQWGRVMALDGIVQTTEKDEFVYHEMMTHLPMLAHGQVRKVLIIGGGDGGILREVLRHQQVETVTQVEIDQQVIDMCQRYLPNHSAGAFAHPKANIVISDGVEYVASCQEKFDLIISDSTDPIGPGESLFTSRFYQGVADCLNEGGIFVAQNGVSFMQLEEVQTTAQRLQPHFADVGFYAAAVPTYVGGIMTFAWASQNAHLRVQSTDVISDRFEQAALNTRYYNPDIHQGSFALPQYVKTAIQPS